MRPWAMPLAALGLAAYAAASWWLMSNAPDRAWTVLALFGPMVGAIALNGLRRRHGPTLLACLALVAVLVAVWLRGGVDVNRLYVMQHAAIHALMGWTFGVTLRDGATPLITALAERLHPLPMQADQRRYTARLTVGWVVYFIAMVVVSLVLYLAAPWPVWSFFCTVLTPLFAGSFFVLEYVWRRWRHPEFQVVHLRDAAQAWRTHGQRMPG